MNQQQYNPQAQMGQPQFTQPNTQFAQPGAASGQYSSMFSNMGMPETPMGQPTPKDPNEWQLQCDAQHTDVEAIIRILPRGYEGVKANMWPQVNCRKHYLATRDGKRFGDRFYVCRGNIPDPSARHGRSYCPICSKIWDRYYQIKNQWGDQAAKDSGISGNLPTDDIVVNVLIVKDFVNPDNNGQIKVWTAKPKQWEKVMSALPEKNLNKDGAVAQQYTSTPKYIGIPWHVLSGANFHLKGTWDNTKSFKGHNGKNRNGAANWDSSYFETTPTPLGPNDDVIMQVLGQCHDLGKYDIAPMSVDELDKVQLAFFAAYDGAPATAADNNNNIAANGYPTYNQPAPYGQATQQAPQGGPQTMPASAPSAYVPPQPKTTVGNAGAFFGNTQAPNYGAPNGQQSMFAGQPATPAPAQAPAPAFNPAPAAAAPAPQPMQYAQPGPATAPAAPAAPAPYSPPAAPAPQQSQFGAPTPAPAQGGPTVVVGDDDELPF